MHPFHLPQGMDLFKWSVPFLMEKIGDMMEHLMKRSNANKFTDGANAESFNAGDLDVQAILQEQQQE